MLRGTKFKPNSSRQQFCSEEPEVGKVVMIHEDDMRLKWRLAIIQELIKSTDGQVRSAIVKTTLPTKRIELHRNLKTTLKRKAINHLYPLELNVENYRKEESIINFDTEEQIENNTIENEEETEEKELEILEEN